MAICLKLGAVPIGGMVTPLPSHDPHVNEVAAVSTRADKQWEAAHGFLRGWVAHIFHMQTAAAPFKTCEPGAGNRLLKWPIRPITL